MLRASRAAPCYEYPIDSSEGTFGCLSTGGYRRWLR